MSSMQSLAVHRRPGFLMNISHTGDENRMKLFTGCPSGADQCVIVQVGRKAICIDKRYSSCPHPTADSTGCSGDVPSVGLQMHTCAMGQFISRLGKLGNIYYR